MSVVRGDSRVDDPVVFTLVAFVVLACLILLGVAMDWTRHSRRDRRALLKYARLVGVRPRRLESTAALRRRLTRICRGGRR